MMNEILAASPVAQYDELREEIDAALHRVLDHGYYILGPEVSAFEREFADYIGVKHGIGVSSGTDALHLSLCALGVGVGDEVITTPHTAVATVAAIEQSGAMPVLVDIDPITYCLDPAWLERVITPRTKAIVPVHLYGHPANLAAILEFADSHKLYVLEDCAQAHGSAWRNQKLGSYGHIAAFSFYPTKNLGAIGDGGMIVTNDDHLVERVRQLREYGWKQRYVSDTPGFNSRLDELQAALLRVKLRHLDHDNERRRALAKIYSTQLANKFIRPIEQEQCHHVYHLYVIRHPQRDALRTYLQAQGVYTGIQYPVAVHLQPAYVNRLGSLGSFPNAEQAMGEVLSLPLYPQLSKESVMRVIDVLHSFPG